MLTDSHAHINDEAFGGVQNVVRTMKEDGLGRIVCVGCDEKTSRESAEAAVANERVFAVVGVHPYYPETVTDRLLQTLADLAACPKVVAIGEVGLDYHLPCDRAAQMRAMRAQCDLANELKLPVVFHLRDAAGDFCEFIKDRDFPFGGVIHCFSGSRETAETYLSKGFYISFSGTVTYRNAKKLAEAAAVVPLDKLLIETDSPYLTPAPVAGQKNHPRFVRYVAQKLADIKGVDEKTIEDATARNAAKVFYKIAEYEGKKL